MFFLKWLFFFIGFLIVGLIALASRTMIKVGLKPLSEVENTAEKIAAGADAVQVYTGLIYRGPALVSECVKAMAAARR